MSEQGVHSWDPGAEQRSAPAELKPLDEDWQSALCIVAHPDDLEFGAASAVARWTGQGKSIGYVMVTSGEAGIDGLGPEECRTVREAEQVDAARQVGVDQVDFLGLPDGILEYGIPLRAAICAAIRRHRPEIVITGNFHPFFGTDRLNQADHIATGRAVLDAVRDAANQWIFHDQIEAGLPRWPGVRQVWEAASPQSGHGVDISDHLEAGIASLAAHRAYLDGLDFEIDPEEFLEGFARQDGTRFGTRFATAFQVYTFR
jgi:LmbE family N-acetylglucosaminyl deacetylase